MVKNGEPFIKPALESVLPFVKTALVMLDESSTDNTANILKELQKKYSNLFVETFEHPDDIRELTSVRNSLLDMSTEEWVLILDDDEVYPQEAMERLVALSEEEQKTLVAYRSWFIINETLHHRSFSRKWIPRLVRRKGVRWGEEFGKEALHKDGIPLWRTDEMLRVPEIFYLHFTYLKPWSWRQESGISYSQDYLDKHPLVAPMPPKVINQIKKVYEQL